MDKVRTRSLAILVTIQFGQFGFFVEMITQISSGHRIWPHFMSVQTSWVVLALGLSRYW